MAQQHAWPCWALEHRLTQVYRLQMTRFRNFGVNCQRPGWGITRGAFDALLGALKQAKAISGDPFSDPDVESFFAALVELAERDQAPLAAFVASWELWQSAAQQWCSGPRRLGAHHGRGIQAHIAKHQNHRQ
jgi:hypothetical protein